MAMHDALPHAARELVRVVVQRGSPASGMRTASSSSMARAARAARARRRGPAAPRRSGRRSCRPGRARSSVPGRRSRFPRRARAHISRSLERAEVATLEADLGRQPTRPGARSSRTIDSAVTDLPLPDSPTSPSVSPAAMSKLTPSTAVARAAVQIEDRRQVARRNQDGHQTSALRGFLVHAKHLPHRVGDLADCGAGFDRGDDGGHEVAAVSRGGHDGRRVRASTPRRRVTPEARARARPAGVRWPGQPGTRRSPSAGRS